MSAQAPSDEGDDRDDGVATSELPRAELEKRFALQSQILRAQHFAWREAVAELAPELDPGRLVLRLWELVGRDTAAAYARRIDRERHVPEQVAACIVKSSLAMGEDARVEPGASEDEAFVQHDACPWHAWHARQGLEAEDLAGCDRWFETTLAKLGEALGVELAFETLASLPGGDVGCRRRIRVVRR